LRACISQIATDRFPTVSYESLLAVPGRSEPFAVGAVSHRRVTDPLLPDGNGAFEVTKSETSLLRYFGGGHYFVGVGQSNVGAE
jgi:hypothetical protein